MNTETIINDIDIVKDAINNKDYNDAIQMLNEIIVELKIINEVGNCSV
jgi:hypothetical protein